MKILSLSMLAGASMMLISEGVWAEHYLPEIASKAPYKKAYAEMLGYPNWVSIRATTQRLSLASRAFRVVTAPMPRLE